MFPLLLCFEMFGVQSFRILFNGNTIKIKQQIFQQSPNVRSGTSPGSSMIIFVGISLQVQLEHLLSTIIQVRVTRRVSLVEQELLIIPDFIPDFQWGFCCPIFGFICSVLLIVVRSVLRFMTSDGPFGIFKLLVSLRSFLLVVET